MKAVGLLLGMCLLTNRLRFDTSKVSDLHRSVRMKRHWGRPKPLARALCCLDSSPSTKILGLKMPCERQPQKQVEQD